MSYIISVRGFSPKIPESCFIAPNATVIGDTEMGEECSIWFNAVVRGDVNSIRMGSRVNVQDGVVIHCTYERTKTIIGSNVSIGHRALVHGCKIEDNVIVGMGAIIMDNAEIGANSIIAAGAVVLQNTVVPPGSIFAGVPAKKIKNIVPELITEEIERVAENYYAKYSRWYQEK